MKKALDEKIKYKLAGIELVDVHLIHPEKLLPANYLYHFNINLEYKINIEKSFILVICYIEIMQEDKKTKLGSVKTSCMFEINELERFLKNENIEINLPEEILLSLNSVTISTTRGILFSQFRGTFLHNAQLPLVDPRIFKPIPKV